MGIPPVASYLSGLGPKTTVLAAGHFAAWLDPRRREPARLLPLLDPYLAESMERRPVDRRVNSVRVDGPGTTAAVGLPALTESAPGAR